MAHVAHRGGIILFVARQPQMVHMVERTAVECVEYAQCRQWSTEIFTATTKVSVQFNILGGVLKTNNSHYKTSQIT